MAHLDMHIDCESERLPESVLVFPAHVNQFDLPQNRHIIVIYLKKRFMN